MVQSSKAYHTKWEKRKVNGGSLGGHIVSGTCFYILNVPNSDHLSMFYCLTRLLMLCVAFHSQLRFHLPVHLLRNPEFPSFMAASGIWI